MNRSYCQFRNTAADLDQVYETLKDAEGDYSLEEFVANISDVDEEMAVGRLIDLCKAIIDLVEDMN